MHGERLAQIGLAEAIKSEFKILENTGQFKTQFITVGDAYPIETQKEMILFRIVQEAINNAIKYSQATAINITLDYGPQFLLLSVTDNGIGFNPETLPVQQKGIGLLNMKNRALLVGGTFSLRSAAGNGTEISIRLKQLNNLVKK